MHSDNAPLLAEEKLFENLFGVQVRDALNDVKVADSEILQHGLEFVPTVIGH